MRWKESNQAVLIENLNFTRADHKILQNISLEVKHGEFLGIVGPNGGGKSTLIKLIAGLLEPTSGSVKIYGKSPKEQGKIIGFVPQDTNFNNRFPITAIDVVKMGFLASKEPDQEQKAEEMLARLGIDHLAYRKIGELSGGERQRVFIARSLVADIDILLLDEPTASIDARSEKEIFELLASLVPEITIVMISHDISMLLGYATRVAAINRKVVHLRELPSHKPDDLHICEVELLEAFLSRKKQ